MVMVHPSCRLRRSALFVPADKIRAIEKSRTQAADALLFDLEDAVAPANKQQARDQLTRTLNIGCWQCLEKIVRINSDGNTL
ncbi:MAG TPA: hypothetical protein ENI62_14910 [Gammaproteobacteria bacterium]|nr:hypothetical protein [Gammaproteobacteria bacterium]